MPCSRCYKRCTASPACKVVDPVSSRDLYPWMVVYASLLRAEDVPLYHVCPGGAALRIVVPGAVYECSVCWWRDYTDPEGLVLRRLRVEDVLGLVGRTGADIVLVDGGEPLIHGWVVELVKGLRGHGAGVFIVVKTSGLVNPAWAAQAIEESNALIVEPPYDQVAYARGARLVYENIRRAVGAGKIVETHLLYDGSKRVESLAGELVDAFGENIVLHVIPLSEAVEDKAYKLVERLREKRRAYAYLYGDTSYTLTSTRCPRCGTAIVTRIEDKVAVNIAKRGEGAACPRCGHPIPLRLCGRRRVRPRTLPREIVVY